MPARPSVLRFYYFAIFAALGLYLPFFPRWLEGRGIEGLAMGVVAATLPAMGLVGPPAFGLIADALGLRGALLRLACLGACLAFVAIALAALAGRALDFAMLFPAALAFALFRSPLIMMADVVALEEAQRTRASYGRIRLWGSIGFLLAALAGGRWLDPRAAAPFPVAMALTLLAALVAAWGLPTRAAAPPVPAFTQARAILAAPAFRAFLAIVFCAQTAHASYDLCYSLRLRDLGADGTIVGAAWAIGVLAEIALMAASSALFARFTAPRLIALALLGAAVRWALIASLRSVPLLLAIGPLHALSFGLAWVASLAYVRESAPAHAGATAQGLFSAATAAGQVTGMLAWGALYRRAGGGPTFACAAVIAAVACLLAVAWSSRAAFPAIQPVGKGAET